MTDRNEAGHAERPQNPFYLLRNAVFWDREEALRLIAAAPSILEARSGLCETALHFLAVENEIDAVTFLVKQGANVNTVNDFGDTPLMDAACLNYRSLCNYLMHQGADPLYISPRGDTALWEAATSSKTNAGNTETFLLMLEQVRDHDINDFIQEYDAREIIAGTHKRVSSSVAALLIAQGLTRGFSLPDDEDKKGA